MDLRLGACSQFAARIRSQGGSEHQAAGPVELGILWGYNFRLGRLAGSLRLVSAEEGNYCRMDSSSLGVVDTRRVELPGEAGLWAHKVAVGNRHKHVPAQLLDLIPN